MKKINLDKEGGDFPSGITRSIELAVQHVNDELARIPNEIRIQYKISIEIWREQDDGS